MKSSMKAFIRKLVRLDMNIVLIARQKEYDGVQSFDADKSIPFILSTNIQLFINGTGEYMARLKKDRCLPDKPRFPGKEFKASYDVFERALGKETLERKAVVVEGVSPEQVVKINELIVELSMPRDIVHQSLLRYNCDRIEDLNASDAKSIIELLETKK